MSKNDPQPMELIAEWKDSDGKKKICEVSHIEIWPEWVYLFHSIPYGQERCTKQIKREDFIGVTKGKITAE